MVKKLLERFMKNKCERQIKQFRIEKVIKKKGDELYVKRKSCDNSFESCVDKKIYCYTKRVQNHVVIEEKLK